MTLTSQTYQLQRYFIIYTSDANSIAYVYGCSKGKYTLFPTPFKGTLIFQSNFKSHCGKY